MSAIASLGLDAARAADPERFQIGGVTPRLAMRPESREELCEALRVAARAKLAVVPWGGGTSLGLEVAPPRYDLALETTALDRVVDYEPEDMTVTVECGITLASLGRLLAERRQELPVEGAHAGRATLGGAFAANASGARRLRFGAPRDRILGARFALADGTLAKSGGRVVKNVAGYATHRLLCGSRGGLAVFVEASLKVTPAPERRVAYLFVADERLLRDAGRWRAIAAIEPAAMTVLGGEAVRAAGAAVSSAPNVVVLGFEDDAPWVESQLATVAAALGEPTVQLEGGDVVGLWQRLADASETSGAWIVFTTADNRPDALAPVLESAGPAFVFHAPAGRLHLRVGADGAEKVVEGMRARGFIPIAARGVTLREAPHRSVAIAALRERLRQALDPESAFGLGTRAR